MEYSLHFHSLGLSFFFSFLLVLLSSTLLLRSMRPAIRCYRTLSSFTALLVMQFIFNIHVITLNRFHHGLTRICDAREALFIPTFRHFKDAHLRCAAEARKLPWNSRADLQVKTIQEQHKIQSISNLTNNNNHNKRRRQFALNNVKRFNANTMNLLCVCVQENMFCGTPSSSC